MKAMLTAFVMSGLIAVGANAVLNQAGFGADQATTSASVRLDSN